MPAGAGAAGRNPAAQPSDWSRENAGRHPQDIRHPLHHHYGPGTAHYLRRLRSHTGRAHRPGGQGRRAGGCPRRAGDRRRGNGAHAGLRQRAYAHQLRPRRARPVPRRLGSRLPAQCVPPAKRDDRRGRIRHLSPGDCRTAQIRHDHIPGPRQHNPPGCLPGSLPPVGVPHHRWPQRPGSG